MVLGRPENSGRKLLIYFWLTCILKLRFNVAVTCDVELGYFES